MSTTRMLLIVAAVIMVTWGVVYGTGTFLLNQQHHPAYRLMVSDIQKSTSPRDRLARDVAHEAMQDGKLTQKEANDIAAAMKKGRTEYYEALAKDRATTGP